MYAIGAIAAALGGDAAPEFNHGALQLRQHAIRRCQARRINRGQIVTVGKIAGLLAIAERGRGAGAIGIPKSEALIAAEISGVAGDRRVVTQRGRYGHGCSSAGQSQRQPECYC